jgi:hypothetical protein
MERTDTCWYYRDQSWKTRAKLILVFFSCPFLSLSLSLSLSSPTRPALPRDLPLPVLAAVLSLYLFDPAMAAPAPATAGELLRIDPLELRFPCTCSSALSPALFCFSSFFGVGGKSLFFYLPCFCRRGSIGS